MLPFKRASLTKVKSCTKIIKITFFFTTWSNVFVLKVNVALIAIISVYDFNFSKSLQFQVLIPFLETLNELPRNQIFFKAWTNSGKGRLSLPKKKYLVNKGSKTLPIPSVQHFSFQKKIFFSVMSWIDYVLIFSIYFLTNIMYTKKNY